MRLLRSFGRAAGHAVLHPAVWGTALILASVVWMSIAIARFVVAPVIFASDDKASMPPAPNQSSSVVRAEQRQNSEQIRRRRVAESDAPVKITLVRSDPPLRKWHRHRKHVPDVVYRAPEDSPRFGDGVQKAESPVRDTSSDLNQPKDEDRSSNEEGDNL